MPDVTQNFNSFVLPGVPIASGYRTLSYSPTTGKLVGYEET